LCRGVGWWGGGGGFVVEEEEEEEAVTANFGKVRSCPNLTHAQSYFPDGSGGAPRHTPRCFIGLIGEIE
jgi:hypothetical protein